MLSNILSIENLKILSLINSKIKSQFEYKNCICLNHQSNIFIKTIAFYFKLINYFFLCINGK